MTRLLLQHCNDGQQLVIWELGNCEELEIKEFVGDYTCVEFLRLPMLFWTLCTLQPAIDLPVPCLNSYVTAVPFFVVTEPILELVWVTHVTCAWLSVKVACMVIC